MPTVEALIIEAQDLIASGKLEEAMTPYLSAKEMAFSSGNVVVYIQCCQEIAAILDNLERHLDAAKELDLAINASTLDVTTSAGLLINKGVALLRARMFQASADAFLESIKLIRKVPPRVRTPEMHNINDLAYENYYLVKDLIKAEAEGKTIELKKED